MDGLKWRVFKARYRNRWIAWLPMTDRRRAFRTAHEAWAWVAAQTTPPRKEDAA